MLNEQLLISKEDLERLRLAKSIDSLADGLDTAIYQAQRGYVYPRFAPALYLQLCGFTGAVDPNNPTPEEAAIIGILEGDAIPYDDGCGNEGINFGLKTAVAYFTLAELTRDAGAMHTASGVNYVNAEYAMPLDPSQLDQLRRDYLTKGQNYLDGAVNYARSKSSDLTNWKEMHKEYQGQKGGLRAYTVKGRTRNLKQGDTWRYDEY